MSLLKIAKKALANIGVREISSLTQQGAAADRCNEHVEDAVREVLRAHPWSFATDWASLAMLAETPPFGYAYAYAFPSEVVRLVDVRQNPDLRANEVEYEVKRGNIIYTDASPCYARYTVYFESDLATAPPDFIDACAWKLADIIKIPLAKSSNVVNTEQRYLRALDKAILGDASTVRERVIDENVTNSILAARGYPGNIDEGGF